jgi:RNA polymerase sigma-70 factor (ECF subfamily)
LTRESQERTRAAVEQTVREQSGHVLAVLMGEVRDLELAEDVFQDALVEALRHWPDRGVPDQPRAWLLRTARRKAIDRFRRDTSFRSKREQLELLAELESRGDEYDVDESIPDERLRLVFTCCHPALAEQARVALTLRTLGGLTTTEIARAFLVPETTMGQRLVRAKRKIKAANIPYRVPPSHLWPERLDSVLSVVYFIFNEGYVATSGGELTREDLCAEAIRLGRILVGLAPAEPEVAGLLALMLLHDSRRPARTDDAGNFVTLEQQDRDLWDREKIEAGKKLLKAALGLRRPGSYQVQAAISAVHADAESYAVTDWRQIVLLYRKLYELQPSRVIRLNAAVALSWAEGVEAGLAALDELERQGGLETYQPLHAARADLLRRAGRSEEAAEAYRRALELTSNATEQRFLEKRLSELPN